MACCGAGGCSACTAMGAAERVASSRAPHARRRRAAAPLLGRTGRALLLAVVVVFALAQPADAFFGGGGRRRRQRQPEREKKPSRDFYALLGVDKQANTRAIKRAFRKLSLKYHPDKNPGDEDAKQKYTDVTAAYDVLSDKEKRRAYDQGGEEGVEQAQAQAQAGAQDPFGGMFGGMFGRRGGGDEDDAGPRGADTVIPTRVTLRDLYLGKVLAMSIKKQILCPQCRGTGARDEDSIRECRACGGQGHTIERRSLGPGFVQQVQVECAKCGGKGKIITAHCRKCSGKKVVPGDEELDVFVERGMPDGHVIEYAHQGDEKPDINAGHLKFKLQTVPHPRFRREGADLRVTFHITLLDALVGFKRELEHLDGHMVLVVKSSVTHPGEVMTVEEEGMPVHETPSETGKLYVEFVIDFPTSLTKAQISGFESVLS